MVGETEGYLWPDALSDEQRSQISDSEVIQVYAHRSQVPASLWERLLDGASERIEVLVYAGLFLTEEHGVAGTLCNPTSTGGAMEFGESIKQTAIRETLEETGIEIDVTGLVGIYTNPERRIEYTNNGEVRQEFSIVFHGRPISGQPATSSESSEVEWVEPHRLDQLSMNADVRKRIDQALRDDPEPYLG